MDEVLRERGSVACRAMSCVLCRQLFNPQLSGISS
jgi:hypothetical protein